MRPITVTVGPLTAATTNNIALSQTPAGKGSLTLNGSLVSGGVATIANAQRVKITTTDTTTTFTITGTTPTGTLLTESLVAVAGSATSTLDYSTVTSITVNQGTTAAVTVGTSGIGSTPWVRLDEYAPSPVGVFCDASGTVNYTIQQTGDDPNSPTNPVLPSAVTWITTADTNGAAATTSIASFFPYAPIFARVLLNSGTGSVTATFSQPGAVPY
jgi:hypothetical protein